MPDIHVTSWSELQDALFASSWRGDIARHRSPYLFRGSSTHPGDLRTSIQRTRLEKHEHHLLKHFRKYGQRTPVSGDSVWNWLALAKHHGLPTRLLDWTYSPFVALHFATAAPAKFHLPGSVWCVDFAKANDLLPPDVRRLLDDEEALNFTAEMLDRLARSLPQFDRIGASEFVLFFEPPSLDERIVNQFALFSVPSTVRLDLEEFFSTHPEILRRIVFPAELKWEIRDKLDQANVTERVLFPGLDGLAAWLARYYSDAGQKIV
ncbi:MAG TPA: FRG domain-containing protein [Thermoanaerobaculia bacterium]